METDSLDAALAAEEHRQGMRYGDDPSHCERCGEEVLLHNVTSLARAMRDAATAWADSPWTPDGDCGCAHTYRDGIRWTYRCVIHQGIAS